MHNYVLPTPFTHIHTPIDASVGNVGFSVLPKEASTSDHQPSNWWATALPPELQGLPQSPKLFMEQFQEGQTSIKAG